MVAFDRHSGEMLWRHASLPPLAASDGASLYGYGRAGTVVAVRFDGTVRWRATVEDDRGDAARRRGLLEGPFVADVVPNALGIAVGAGAEILQLDPGDGAVRRRTAPCREPHASISRLAPVAGGLVCTCTIRTAQDDEGGVLKHGLWDAPRPLDSFRTARGELVALDDDLKDRWRISPPQADFVWSNRAAVPGPDGSITLIASKTERPGALSLFDDQLVSVEAGHAHLRWAVPIDGGRSPWDPVPSVDGVVTGLPPALYRAVDGRLAWQVDKKWHVDPSVRPVAAGSSMYLVEDGRLLSVDLLTGSAFVAAEFARPPLAGTVTTELLVVGGLAYLGVEDAGRRELRAVRLRKPTLQT